MHSSVSVLFFALFICCRVGSSFSQPTNNNTVPENTMRLWANQAFRWLHTKANCSDVNVTGMAEANCLMIKSFEKFHFRIYGTEPNAEGRKIGTIFLDDDLIKRNDTYDGVVVLDPLPNTKFGHPILVFHINILTNKANLTAADCQGAKEFRIEDRYCLQLYTRNQCNPNVVHYERKRVVKTRPVKAVGPNCGEVLFPPMVYLISDEKIQANDKLRCYANIQGFHRSCPAIRGDALNAIACHPFLNNDSHCATYNGVFEGRCSKSLTCDHAIILSGGWNQHLSDESTWNNVMNVKSLLLSHGFTERSIAIFFANGPKHSGKKPKWRREEDDYDGWDPETEKYFSSSMKDTMRNHIRILCDIKYCADTLLIYMNSPAKPDGSSVLWDLFDDGTAGEDELYTPKELFRDLHNCKASRVIIIADQNYGEALVGAAKDRFMYLDNVIIFTANDDFNRNHIGSKDRLIAQLLREKDYDFCLSDFRHNIDRNKSAEYIGYKANSLNFTLVGAPCPAKATPLSDPELLKYRGCNSAPIEY